MPPPTASTVSPAVLPEIVVSLMMALTELPRKEIRRRLPGCRKGLHPKFDLLLEIVELVIVILVWAMESSLGPESMLMPPPLLLRACCS